MALKVQYKHIHFKEKSSTGKTRVYECMNNRTDQVLGEIKWYGAWRQYCWFPSVLIYTVFSADCNDDISHFIRQLEDERRESN